MLAIAAINHTFLLIRTHINQSLLESLEEGVRSITYMTARPLSGAFEDLSADDATDMAVDSAESWLFDAYAIKSSSTNGGDIDLLSTALLTLRLYSAQGAVNVDLPRFRGEVRYWVSVTDVGLRRPPCRCSSLVRPQRSPFLHPGPCAGSAAAHSPCQARAFCAPARACA
jgi:hypothetical protein